jgi:hypothetical protein
MFKGYIETHPQRPICIYFQGIADAYKLKHPEGSAVVSQFKSRPQLLTRLSHTHRQTAMTFAEAVQSPFLPPPTPESLK